MHETVCGIGPCSLKLKVERILERFFDNLAKQVEVGNQVVNEFLFCIVLDCANWIKEVCSLKKIVDTSNNPVVGIDSRKEQQILFPKIFF